MPWPTASAIRSSWTTCGSTSTPGVPRRRELAVLAGLTALAAALRFWHIGSQSYWYDESYTVDLVGRGFGDMISTIPRTESTPPLYYVLAWVWAKLFGT